ncbi:MAG: phosphomannomutase/phosphoglucomutase [Sphingomonadaceae bacterium]|uniref:phosphoglucomutase/phosphomannomutase PgmG n=1 Tax=Thermaurantiacus sp. TaxID=2820283 RepID=UPI00298F3A72|nr:phosphomannomutase/phosphoglucomutase [Thermaurantiacus sp.]MCS6985999.1 phosphomannomutase/phosphoglucomutase [Sphingomonadaceae bacterium]MDW8414785.1 phosphomannomutase/phosphoglucomutase [Thermaurantiacus sp.]
MTGHTFDPTILREYDIRGIVGRTLHDADAHAVGRGFGTVVRRAGGRRVAVGRDGRLSSPLLEDALVQGLVRAGCEAVRIGLGPTPMLYFAVHELGLDGGVMVTGSHNPPDFNGFKMLLADRPFYGDDIRALGTAAARGDWAEGEGTARHEDVRDRYVARLLADFRGPALRVGWDCGNGATGEIVERVLARLPGEHHALHTTVDGRFPHHHPDPTVEANLADLRRLVAYRRLDLGIAFDGDGDRIGAIDARGRVIWGDQLLMILAEALLRECPGATIIADVKASQALFDRVAALGGRPLMWKTGHSLIKAKMKDTGAPLAGEMSGHIFFAHRWYGFDDALYAALRLLEALGALGASLAELKDRMPAVVNTPELRFPCPDERKFTVIEEVLARLRADGARVDATDGARVTTADGWWLLRASNTQPVLVARAESTSHDGLARLTAEIDRQLALCGIARAPVAH